MDKPTRQLAPIALPTGSPWADGLDAMCRVKLAGALRGLLGDLPREDTGTLANAAERMGLDPADARALLATERGELPLPGMPTEPGATPFEQATAFTASLLAGPLEPFRDELLLVAVRRLMQLAAPVPEAFHDQRIAATAPVFERVRGLLSDRGHQGADHKEQLDALRKPVPACAARAWLEQPSQLGFTLAALISEQTSVALARLDANGAAGICDDMRADLARGLRTERIVARTKDAIDAASAHRARPDEPKRARRRQHSGNERAFERFAGSVDRANRAAEEDGLGCRAAIVDLATWRWLRRRQRQAARAQSSPHGRPAKGVEISILPPVPMGACSPATLLQRLQRGQQRLRARTPQRHHELLLPVPFDTS